MILIGIEKLLNRLSLYDCLEQYKHWLKYDNEIAEEIWMYIEHNYPDEIEKSYKNLL